MEGKWKDGTGRKDKKVEKRKRKKEIKKKEVEMERIFEWKS